VARFIVPLRRLAELIAVTLFSAMFGLFILQIFTRYVLGRPFGWTVEACVAAYIWIVFWTSAFVLHERDHVAFTVVYDLVSPARRRLLAGFGAAAIGVAFAAGLPGAFDYVTFMRIESTPVMHLRFDILYSVWLLFMAAVVVRAVVDLVRLVSPHWRDQVRVDADTDVPSSSST